MLTKRDFPDTGSIVAGIDVDFLAEVEAFGGAGLSRVCSYRYQAFTLLLRGSLIQAMKRGLGLCRTHDDDVALVRFSICISEQGSCKNSVSGSASRDSL